MKTILFNLFLFSILCLFVIAEETPKISRRSYSEVEIKERKNTFKDQVGVPLVFHGETKPVSRTEISNKMTEKLNDDDDDDDDEMMNENNAEEIGSGYENIKGMDPDDGEKQSESSGSGDDSDAVDLSGDFPPNADQIAKLPEDVEMTQDEIDRKLADKRKGYIQFTIRQRFQPDFKYKESSAYKILAGNVIQDVEKALKTRNVVKDVLFREAKGVGGPPYRSKVEVFLKLKDASTKKLKKVVNRGLINGMMSVPGSFQVN